MHKSTPPDLRGNARLTRRYPAITATVVNTPIPAISYVNWFSYKTTDFVSANQEIQRTIRTTHWVFPHRKLRFVMDSEGDKQKLFASSDEFIITAKHLHRQVEVYNERLDRWKSEALQDLVEYVPWQVSDQSGRFPPCRSHPPDPPQTGLVSGAFTPNPSAAMGFGGRRRVASQACYSAYQHSLAQCCYCAAGLRRLALARTHRTWLSL